MRACLNCRVGLKTSQIFPGYNFPIEQLHFRKRVVVVGWTDLFLMLISIAFSSYILLIFSPGTLLSASAKNATAQSVKDVLEANGIKDGWRFFGKAFENYDYLWKSSVANLVVAFVQLVAAILLINSTSRTRGNVVSWKMAWCWFIVNSLVMAIYYIWRVLDGNWVMFVVGQAVRGLFICLVSKYIEELRRIIKAAAKGKSYLAPPQIIVEDASEEPPLPQDGMVLDVNFNSFITNPQERL